MMMMVMMMMMMMMFTAFKSGVLRGHAYIYTQLGMCIYKKDNELYNIIYM